MEKRKILLLILLAFLVYGIMLNSGLMKQKDTSNVSVKDFVLSEEGPISNRDWDNNMSGGELVVWNDESIDRIEGEQTSEFLAKVEEIYQTDEEESVKEIKTSEAEENVNMLLKETESKPTTTPQSKPGVEPDMTPESKPSLQPSTTPEDTPSIEPSTPDSTPEASNSPEESNKELVRQGEHDTRVIPDKYSTGCKNTGNMMKINEGMVVDGIEYILGDNGDTVVIDLFYRNTEIPNEVVIKNIDFSDKKFAIRQVDKVEKTIKLIFENCKFAEVWFPAQKSNVNSVFKNCSMRRFYGSNGTFYSCSFGGGVTDGMNPFCNVNVYNSYFSDFDHDNPTGVHTDAIHIYGKENINVENVTFSNCRVELPIIDGGKNTKVNACFTVGLEYSSGKNLLFENCFINGGGFSIYAGASPGFTIENTVFFNVSVGRDRLYGNLYPRINPNVAMNNVRDTETLFVASVWKDGAGKVHLSTTNDTAQDRHLVVETESGRQEFYLPCKKTQEQNYRSSHGRAPYFNELSIDVEVVPDAVNPGWVICYDKCAGTEKQIRFVNWTGGDVYR